MDLKKINHLEINIDAEPSELFEKLKEEVCELEMELLENQLNEEKFKGEFLDVCQCLKGLLTSTNIKITKEDIKKHNRKLLSRGHKLLD